MRKDFSKMIFLFCTLPKLNLSLLKVKLKLLNEDKFQTNISSDNSRQTYRFFLNESIVNHKIPPKERYFGSPAIESVINTDIHIITEIGTRIPYYQNTTSGLKPFNDINFPKIEINMPKLSSISWQQFTKYKRQEVNPNITKRQELVNILKNFKDQECSVSVDDELKKPRLQPKDFAWCQWALSDEGAKVIVGKSWGKLDKKEMLKFDALNCNTVKAGKNPSCDDSWGDEALRKWIRTPQETVGCDNGKKSKVQCYKNDNLDSYCEIENAQIDFSKWRTVKRAGNTDSKSFSQDFLSADCNGKSTEPQFPFPHLYSPILSSTKCDYVHNGTVVLYSHDDIRNLGHTLNDIMNVWVMLWLGRVGTNSDQLNLLNIDSFKLGHNWLDKPNVFFNIYRHNFHQILKGVDFSDKTLCVQKLLIQPIPPRFFIWESWFIDLPCSFTGPSSLYQRYNVIVRDSYGLLPREKGTAPSDLVLKVLLVVRKVYTNLWGNNRSSRNYLNLPAIISSLEKVMASSQILYGAKIKFNLAAIDLNDFSFDEQMKLLGETSIIVGMHGAGMAGSMHMPVGTRFCCGMIEMYPKGEFTPIKGHGNMARKMGIYYDRIDISESNSNSNGATVPPEELAQKLTEMITTIMSKPTCLIPEVITDPYFENI